MSRHPTKGKTGADLRLSAAQALQEKLKLILAGEPPYDIFVRWKPLAEQPIGWNPDLNDGVRLNIRPFVTAGILRKTPNIKWTKDRGNDVPSAPWYPVFKGERINDHHTTLEEKRAARAGNPQMVATFSKQFRSAGPLRGNNLPRDLGRFTTAANGQPPLVSQPGPLPASVDQLEGPDRAALVEALDHLGHLTAPERDRTAPA